MTPLRPEEITLFCEDKPDGTSQRLLEAAIQSLRSELPFAASVRPIGVNSKNDVLVRAKFARTQTVPPLRAFAVRDRDFLDRALVDKARARAFAPTPQDLMAWPLPRHCIESYLLDEELLPPDISLAEIDEAAAARRWLDVARATVDDLAFRLRKIRQGEPTPRPTSRAEAVKVVVNQAEGLRELARHESTEERLAAHVDRVAEDMEADGPLRFRVDGKELLCDLLGQRGREQLARRAQRQPPKGLVDDLRRALIAMPGGWRTDG